MIDLHTHSLLSDGELLPSELVRRAWERGYTAIAITDHVDASNIGPVLKSLTAVTKTLNKHWPIKMLPGVEITHPPVEEIRTLVKFARKNGAVIVVGHGETVSEPVIRGTNRAFIQSKVDILAHPGKITIEDARLAKKMGVYLEITTRKSHNSADRHVYKMARSAGASMVLNTDSHSPDNLVTDMFALSFLKKMGATASDIETILDNSRILLKNKNIDI